MEKKYYTPEVSEFHIGFEYEVSSTLVNGTLAIPKEKEWFKQKFIEDSVYSIGFITHIFEKGYGKGFFRVKYLDLEDFLSLGFIDTGDTMDIARSRIDFEIKSNYRTYSVKFFQRDDSWNITVFEQGLIGSVFRGRVKNKSELKKVLRMINIEFDGE